MRYKSVFRAALAVALVTAVPVAAKADTDPPSGTPATVSADPLPTWQIDGVVWSQALVGNTVYATGSFTKARPPGTDPGDPQEVSRQNILAYDITTGNLVTSFNHSLNGQGLRVVASPDGKRVYVGGEFTTVDGQTRNHIAAFDTATGALDPDFHPSVSAKVRAIAATGSTVYYGGNFFNVDGHARTRLAASTASDGALLDWKPTADDDEVFALAVAPDAQRVVIGGRFQTLNGAKHVGVGAVDGTTGASVTWNSTPIPAKSGSNFSYVTDLITDGTYVYAADDGEGGHWFDGRWAARMDNGDLVWLDNCYGATYSVAQVSQVLYSVSHAHDCASLNAFRDTSPTTWHRALAETTYPTGADMSPPGSNSSYSHQPVPSLLHWFPTLSPGTYTGQGQAAWSVVGNDDYVALGGEFPRVDGRAQQGLTRFAIRSTAPDKKGPEGIAAPTVTALPGGAVRVGWQTTWDHDNATLRYDVYRDNGTTPIGTKTISSSFWRLPTAAVLDTGSGAHTYKVKVTDPLGNSVTSAASNSVTAGAGTTSAYRDEVLRDGASHLWRLGETSGTRAYDWAATDDATTGSGVTRNVTGALAGDSDKAATFNGTSSGTAGSTQAALPANLSVEAWVKTNSTRGGKIVGYGSAASGNSSSDDRHLYMDNAGHVYFGVYPGAVRTVHSANTYNNNAWHHVAGTLSGDGMKLYVDGTLVASDASTTASQDYTGYWRIGGDNLSGWTAQPSSGYLSGSIDEVAVYPQALTATQVATHYGVGKGTIGANKPPTAAFTSSCTEFTCAFDASGSTDSDGTIASYSWDFGDGSTGTGATPRHTYASAGDRTVTLTVTDDRGGTGTVSHTVSVTSATLAGDAFNRTVSGGLGTADVGGPWTITGNAANVSVDGSAAKIALPTVSGGPGAYLNDVSATDADVSATVSSDKAGTGNGVYFWLAGRRVSGAGEYRARVRFKPGGVVGLQLSRTDAANAETAIVAETDVSGLTYGPGTVLHVRMQATGTSPTTLRAKVWADGTAEPDWQATGTDSTSGLQVAGGVGLRTYLSGSATNAPVTLTLDDFLARRP